jgi:hypothetical protein
VFCEHEYLVRNPNICITRYTLKGVLDSLSGKINQRPYFVISRLIIVLYPVHLT